VERHGPPSDVWRLVDEYKDAEQRDLGEGAEEKACEQLLPVHQTAVR
jgi:hypothetical protein